jgi:hypothetical protein
MNEASPGLDYEELHKTSIPLGGVHYYSLGQFSFFFVFFLPRQSRLNF